MLISHEELFLQTVQDLRTKIQADKPYELIRACGLCRHLLLDEQPLMNQVNKKYKLKITFHIADYSNTSLLPPLPKAPPRTVIKYPPGGGARTIEPIIDQTKFVKLEEFLKTKVLYYRNIEFTVKEMLSAASHYFGGIHSGNPDTKQSYLYMLDRYLNMETKMSLFIIRSICKVVLTSMEQLESAIKGNAPTGGFSPQSSAA